MHFISNRGNLPSQCQIWFATRGNPKTISTERKPVYPTERQCYERSGRTSCTCSDAGCAQSSTGWHIHSQGVDKPSMWFKLMSSESDFPASKRCFLWDSGTATAMFCSYSGTKASWKLFLITCTWCTSTPLLDVFNEQISRGIYGNLVYLYISAVAKRLRLCAMLRGLTVRDCALEKDLLEAAVLECLKCL